MRKWHNIDMWTKLLFSGIVVVRKDVDFVDLPSNHFWVIFLGRRSEVGVYVNFKSVRWSWHYSLPSFCRKIVHLSLDAMTSKIRMELLQLEISHHGIKW